MPETSPQRSSRSARVRAKALEEGTTNAVRASAPLEVLAAQAIRKIYLWEFSKDKYCGKSSWKILGTIF